MSDLAIIVAVFGVLGFGNIALMLSANSKLSALVQRIEDVAERQLELERQFFQFLTGGSS